jgi:hypothetical protein
MLAKPSEYVDTNASASPDASALLEGNVVEIEIRVGRVLVR